MVDGLSIGNSLYMSTNTPSIDQLKRAVQISEEIAKLEAQLKAVLGGGASVGRPPKVAVAAVRKGRKKSGMSAEGRARIIAAQKARWAKVRAEKGETPAKSAGAPKKRRKNKISPEGLARIKAAQKARWAKFRKGN